MPDLNLNAASPDTPSSYYYDERDMPPPAPEDVDARLRRIDGGGVGAAAGRVAGLLAGEAAGRRRREVIGGVDNFWLLLSDITEFNPACTSVFVMRDHVTVEMMAEQLSRQAEKFPRYRQRLESVGRLLHGPVFVDVPEFDVRNHIHVRRLPGRAGKRELDALVGEFIAEPWDLTRPLWDTLLVENYCGEDAVCAVIARGRYVPVYESGLEYASVGFGFPAGCSGDKVETVGIDQKSPPPAGLETNLPVSVQFAQSREICRHHTLSDGQGFVISQLFLTSYYDDLAHIMDSAKDKLSKAKRGLLLPSEYSKSLGSLDPYARDHPIAPLVHILLALLYWLTTLTKTVVSVFWSTYQALRMVLFVLFTFWRVDMVSADQSSTRTPHREFSSSRVFNIHDVKLCQQAFSGPRPGYAVAGVPKHQQKNARSKVGHVTLNDVICAIMADVLGNVIASKPEPKSARGRFRRFVNRYLPTPIGFFIPISLRQPGDWSMRNLSTASNVYLNPSRTLTADVSIREIHEHIHKCRYELSLFKHSAWPKACFHILQPTGQAPIYAFPLSWFPRSKENNPVVKLLRRSVIKPFIDACLQSFTAILTNIPGPTKKPITWHGVEVVRWTAIPPQAGSGTIGIGIISYAGGISIGVSADLVPDSEGVARRICEGFEARFELYVSRAKEVLEHQE